MVLTLVEYSKFLCTCKSVIQIILETLLNVKAHYACHVLANDQELYKLQLKDQYFNLSLYIKWDNRLKAVSKFVR